jgi:hypothetical protein
MSTLLTTLKYFGLVLATGSSIRATVNVLSQEATDGRKQLVTAGFVAIALTVVGLITSLISEDLQRRKSAREKK